MGGRGVDRERECELQQHESVQKGIATTTMQSPHIAVVAHNRCRNDRCMAMKVPAQRADLPSYHACGSVGDAATFHTVSIDDVYGDDTMSGYSTVA